MKLSLHTFHKLPATIIMLAFMPLNMNAQRAVNDSLLKALNAIDLPLISIETDGHVTPAFTRIDAPAGCFGVGITDNNYCSGRMTITHQGKLTYDSGSYEADVSGMRIRVRGNTSANFNRQTPYKLKLSKKADLMGRQEKTFRNKNWALLSPSVNDHLLFIPLGTEVARIICNTGGGDKSA